MRRSVTAAVGVVVLAGSTVAFAATRATRPTAEHVPASVDHVRIAYRDSADASQNKTIDLHGNRADHIVNLFNALKREPPGTAHCLAIGTAQTRVIFNNSDHKWVASEAICTDVTVARDGKPLPTLIETKAWNDALTHYLGHSPTGTGQNPQAR